MQNAGTGMRGLDLFSNIQNSAKLQGKQLPDADQKTFSNLLLNSELKGQLPTNGPSSKSSMISLPEATTEKGASIKTGVSVDSNFSQSPTKMAPETLLKESGETQATWFLFPDILMQQPQSSVSFEPGINSEVKTILEAAGLLEVKTDMAIKGIGMAGGDSEKTELEKSMVKMLEQISQLVPAIKEEETSAAASKVLLNLLGQWKELEHQFGNSGKMEQVLQRESAGPNKMAVAIWSKLTETYQKRAGMENSSKYQEQASVSSTDISRWVKQALTHYSSNEPEEIKPVIQQGSLAAGMSKVEQFVIHLQQTGNREADDQKLLQEFQRVLNTSKLIQSNGTTELLLKLKPANLGEVLVKMVEVNGEMLVKISVSSQTAKEALEGNMTQLRHMFSPSQVLIEKQETNSSVHESYQPEAEHGELADESFAEEEASETTVAEPEEENESTDFVDYLTAEKEQVS